MNYGRLALAAVVATIVDGVYGFLVYGMLLAPQFAASPAVYRQADAANSHMPFIFLGTFVAMVAATYIYSKGYEGGGGLQEGLGFGAAIGLFAVGYTAIVNYATLNIDHYLGMHLAIAAFAEWILAGIVIGLLYKPAKPAVS
jgi:hypothetical protein